MNKVILMGRLTRDSRKLDIRRARVQMQLPDIHWQLTVGLREREMQRRILSVVYALVSWQNLQRSIYIRRKDCCDWTYPNRKLYE